MAKLERLIKLARPPEQPEAVPTTPDWKTLEEVEELSRSYKEFVAAYGAGVFSECLNLLSAI